jgi:hypothetical protein
MQPVYREHALGPDDALALVAFLEEADRQGVEPAAPLPLKFFLLALGGAVLGLATISALGAALGWRRRPPAPAMRPGSALPAPKKEPGAVGAASEAENCVGLGL